MTQLCHLRVTPKWHLFDPFLNVYFWCFFKLHIDHSKFIILKSQKTRFFACLKTQKWHFFQKLFERFLTMNFHDFSVFSETENVAAAAYGQNFRFLKFQVLPKRSRAPVTFYSTNSLKKSIKNRHFWSFLGHPNLTLFHDLVRDHQKTSHLPYFSKITLNF